MQSRAPQPAALDRRLKSRDPGRRGQFEIPVANDMEHQTVHDTYIEWLYNTQIIHFARDTATWEDDVLDGRPIFKASEHQKKDVGVSKNTTVLVLYFIVECDYMFRLCLAIFRSHPLHRQEQYRPHINHSHQKCSYKKLSHVT
jgi:hypothetical protein